MPPDEVLARRNILAGYDGGYAPARCRATINVRIRDNQDERAFRLWRLREGVGVPGMGTGLEVKVLCGASW